MVFDERRWLMVASLLLVGCGYEIAQFSAGPVVQTVHDRRPIAKPLPRLSHGVLYRLEARAEHHVVQGMTVARPPVAGDVNRLDHVVTSSWFRGAGSASTLDGYERDGPPHMPFVVDDPKPESALVDGGVVIRDARGLTYDLFFDPPGYPESRTAAWPIASRLVHALGYHAAEAYAVESMAGRRAVAVRRDPQRDLGPTPPLWTRTDDANDRLEHDARRTLRASMLWMQWLGSTKISPATFRDVFVGPLDGGFVEHRVVDLSAALGVARLDDTLEHATEPFDDDVGAGWLLVTFGLAPLADPDALPTEGRGLIAFKPAVKMLRRDLSPPFGPHDHVRPDDLYWMARRIAAVPPAVIMEAIEAGRLSDVDERHRVRATLMKRRRALLSLAFSVVTPVRPVSLRLSTAERGATVELGLVDDERRQLGSARPADYQVVIYDGDGKRIGQGQVRAKGAVFGVSVTLTEPEEVAVVRLAKRRGGEWARAMEIHVDLDARRLRGVLH